MHEFKEKNPHKVQDFAEVNDEHGHELHMLLHPSETRDPYYRHIVLRKHPDGDARAFVHFTFPDTTHFAKRSNAFGPFGPHGRGYNFSPEAADQNHG